MTLPAMVGAQSTRPEGRRVQHVYRENQHERWIAIETIRTTSVLHAGLRFGKISPCLSLHDAIDMRADPDHVLEGFAKRGAGCIARAHANLGHGSVGAEHLASKILIDIANPIDPASGWPPPP